MISKYITYQHSPIAYQPCPRCKLLIGYYSFSSMAGMVPHFYCERCSNIFFSSEHRKKVWGKKLTQQLLHEIEVTLPSCPCSGHFRPGQNFKCPHCRHEIQPQNNPIQQLADASAILVEGAFVISDEQEKPAFQLRSSNLISRDLQGKIHLMILSTNLLDSLPTSNEIEIEIKNPVPSGVDLVQAHSFWGVDYFPKAQTPANLPRQPDQAICPSNLVRIWIDCIEKKNPGMGSFFGYTGYFLSVLVSLLSETIWDVRGDHAT